ncbi:VanZ family protein [Neisseria dentiae]|uniref:VanZ family protein n=1 Tax=Neisseria dentiae TaxID=194197 RepID=UPI0035A12109
MRMPNNRFVLFAVLWFFAVIYSLLLKESDDGTPPFAHFDKVAHFALFFGQFWLLAKAFMRDGLAVPYRLLFVSAVLVAAGSEMAQALLTRTREGSIADGLADVLGAAAALWLAHKVSAAKRAVKTV